MGRKEDISRLLAGDDERIFYGKSKEKDEMFLSILPIVSGRLEGVLICAHAYYCIILTPHGRGIFFLSLGIKKMCRNALLPQIYIRRICGSKFERKKRSRRPVITSVRCVYGKENSALFGTEEAEVKVLDIFFLLPSILLVILWASPVW